MTPTRATALCLALTVSLACREKTERTAAGEVALSTAPPTRAELALFAPLPRVMAAPGVATTSDLRGCVAAGTKISLSSWSASKASTAASRWPTCGGSKLPPKIPSRTAQGTADVVAGVGASGIPLQTTRTSESVLYFFRNCVQRSDASSR